MLEIKKQTNKQTIPKFRFVGVVQSHVAPKRYRELRQDSCVFVIYGLLPAASAVCDHLSDKTGPGKERHQMTFFLVTF